MKNNKPSSEGAERNHGWSKDRWLAYKREAMAYCRRAHFAGRAEQFARFAAGRSLAGEIFGEEGRE